MSDILIVENNSLIRSMYVAGLDGLGYSITEASTLVDAFNHLASQPPPAVALLDLELHDGSSVEIIRYIREDLNRDSTQTRIIVATGVAYVEQDLLRLGTDMVLAKPIDLIDLIEKIHAYNS